MKPRFLTAFLLAAAAPAAAFDFNGVALGAPESAIQESLPAAHCQPLQWTSRAADRRCDYAHASFADMPARVTFYLKDGRVVGFEVGFARNDADKVAAYLTQRFGKPAADTSPSHTGGADRERWHDGVQQAVMIKHERRRRASLFVGRRGFEDELYGVR